jgi:hypothetical protein
VTVEDVVQAVHRRGRRVRAERSREIGGGRWH